MPLDLLAIALIVLTAGIALLLRLRYDGRAPAEEDDALFYRQERLDPTGLRLPLTRLGDGSIATEGAYLPTELEMLLEAKGAEPETSETLGLATALDPVPKTRSNTLIARVQDTLAALVILMGLVLLLFWLITIF